MHAWVWRFFAVGFFRYRHGSILTKKPIINKKTDGKNSYKTCSLGERALQRCIHIVIIMAFYVVNLLRLFIGLTYLLPS